MRRGFTLIELMIAVGIIVILATIGMMGLSTFSTNARRARCISNLRVVHAAREAYFFQNPGDSTCPNIATLATAGYFRGRTDLSTGGYPTCPAGSGSYTYPTERQYLETVPTCPNTGMYSDHVLTLYE